MKKHSALLAFVVALLIPGAGQAYNGQPMKGFWLLILAPLGIPWLYSVIDAPVRAARISREGGRLGMGGLFWVFLQAWLFVNMLALGLVIATFGGWLV